MAHFDLSIDELRTYRSDTPEPADFDAFWRDTVAAARAAGGETAVTPLADQLPHVRVDDVTFPGADGAPIKAWLSRPAVADGPLPIVVQFQGYGGGRQLPFEHTFWPSAGYAHLMMDTRGQGSSWGSGGDTADPSGSSAAVPGFMTQSILDPEHYYYRRVFADAVCAVDAARELPGIDPSKVFVAGGSQGGGITIAVAGLVPELAGAMPDVPFLCHYRRATAITDEYPYKEISQYLSVHREHEERAFETLAYFDGVSFARRATAPGLFSVALMDMVCPPSTVFAAYNAYGEIAGDVAKRIEVYPFNGHEGGGAYQGRKQWEFARDTLAAH